MKEDTSSESTQMGCIFGCPTTHLQGKRTFQMAQSPFCPPALHELLGPCLHSHHLCLLLSFSLVALFDLLSQNSESIGSSVLGGNLCIYNGKRDISKLPIHRFKAWDSMVLSPFAGLHSQPTTLPRLLYHPRQKFSTGPLESSRPWVHSL